MSSVDSEFSLPWPSASYTLAQKERCSAFIVAIAVKLCSLV